MITYEKHDKKENPAVQKKSYCQKDKLNNYNPTGIPYDIKTGFEKMSRFSFDDIRVHYNSDKPKQMQALAYTQGNQVYLGPGQEKHLNHELGHVIQQKQNRVKAELSYQGFPINNSLSLEHEADSLGRKAISMISPASLESYENNFKVCQAYSPNPIVQMAEWQWSNKSNRWTWLRGKVSSGYPRHYGRSDGEIFDDDAIQFPPIVKNIKRPPTALKLKVSYNNGNNDKEYNELMEILRDIKNSGGTLTKKEQDQLNTWSSNARAFADILKSYKINAPACSDEWNEALDKFNQNAGFSVFTRDIDESELTGQPVSKGTMSVVERIKRGFGRIRNYSDLNRGGGAGSYVRFISDKKQGDPAKSNLLNAGSIAGLGVTILYDSVSVVKENSAPAHMAFNKQDSAGRVFGTMAASPDELKRSRKLSERLLAKINPNYHAPNRRNKAPILTNDIIMNNAINGVNEMTRQAAGQTPEEEYNEAILFSGGKISSIKAILIHTPAVGIGRPPEKVAVDPSKIQKLKERAKRKKEDTSSKLIAIKERTAEIDAAITNLRGLKFVPEIIKLEKEKAELMEAKRHLILQRIPPILSFIYKNRQEVKTSVSVRSKLTWDGYTVPPLLEPWLACTGYNGVPMRYLFHHINPATIRRAQLPEIAHEIWVRGNAAWKNNILNQKELEKLIEKAKMDLENGTVTGFPLTLSHASKSVPKDKSTDALVKWTVKKIEAPKTEAPKTDISRIHINNCLIDAICMNAFQRLPTHAEISRIRPLLLLQFGYNYGEMLFASQRVIRLIMQELRLHGPIHVHYQSIGEDCFFKDEAGTPIHIKHRGLHFSSSDAQGK